MKDFYATLKIQHGPLRHAIQAAGFKTPGEMAKVMGLSPTNIYDLLNFKHKPINPKTGRWRDNVLKICSFLGFSPAELFPEHLQRIVATNRFETFVSAASLPSAEPPTEQLPPYEAIDKQEIRRMIDEALSTLSESEQEVLRLSFIDGETDIQIAKLKKVGCKRIGQIKAKALRKLRHPTRMRMLNEAHLLIEAVPA